MNKMTKKTRDLKVRKLGRFGIPCAIVDVMVLNGSLQRPFNRPDLIGHVDSETGILHGACVSYDASCGR